MSDARAADNVANHYSSRHNQGKREREKSKIFGLRRLNNWVKSCLILQYAGDGGKYVLDLACGKGGDLEKYKNAEVGYWCAVDIAPDSVRQHARQRYNDPRSNYHFPAQLLCADAFSVDLKPHLNPVDTFDVISCQMAFHYSFATQARVEQCLKNVSECLRPGGYFIGTTTDANVLVKKLRNVEGMAFGNEVYRVQFADRHHSKRFSNDQPFGIEYTFTLEDAVDTLPEYLVPFPVLTQIAEKYGLKLELRANFHDFIREKMTEDVAAELMKKIGVLNPDGSEMSDDEWEATYIYCVFAFKKMGDAKAVAAAALKKQMTPLPERRFIPEEDVIIVERD
mmetsp:Transcript_1916/g.2134  ORF Transcript_1916/g.2134 Transcript_1916/m.2134 type:complete len:338 (+) Transcript_1916:278-1291(+)|eukprot:CAMPEP_0197853494 /NCGR_PEP_ID=MMETSP1438-20131217/22845_1 /TAXON_ID=1461541 /ORGANISM="Pterosperma sp., Strain CCMP1384" /LENGTH=337 /DNA_ID=CAMNT_0043467925 /DNA_START=163 /DNA_END=1176 /DNA_ORIENTATION=-